MNTTGEEFVVEVDGLRKQFGRVVAVRDLALRIPRGGVFGLLGPNGSGKTTTIGLLLGLIRPSAGSIRLFGEDVRDAHHSALRRIGAIVETPAFYPRLSGRANLRYFQGLGRGDGRSADAAELSRLLDLVGLGDRADSRFHTYSLGMKQRLGIAYALLGDPELVFLDEPTNGLDPSGMAEVRDLIVRLGASGRTVVLSSHILREVEQVCTHVAILSSGSLVVQGRVADLLQTHGSVRLSTTDNARAAQLLDGLDGVASVRAEADVLIVGVSPERRGDLTRALCREDVFVTEMVPLNVTLESYFLQVTAGQSAPAEQR